jgi:5-methyltetrahydrofolate--homocysteine methyltransferase
VIPFLERLAAGERMVSDGAFGTQLMAAGLPPGTAPETAIFSDPDTVRAVAAAYADAGADIVHTNTFGGSPLRLAEANLEERTEEINRLAVSLAREGASGRAYVAVSCGPSGRILTPYGDAEPDAVLASFLRQLGAGVEAGADLVTVETMIDVREAVLAVRAARQVSESIPVLVTLTFNSTPHGFRTVMGTSVEQAVDELSAAGADVVGSNCGNGSDVMVELTGTFRAVTDLPLLMQSNAGLPEVSEGSVRYPETAEEFTAAAARFYEAGATIVGGCCGTTPQHIRAIRQVLDSLAA